MDIEYFLSLGNFKEKNFNKGKNVINILNSPNVKFYSDDNFTSVPYEILDYNDSSDFEKNQKRNVLKNVYNNIFTSNHSTETNKKKYIVFVINDFYDTYAKYKNIFKSIIHRLKGQYFEMNNNKNLNQKKRFSNLNINEKDDLNININSKKRPINNQYNNNKKKSLFTHQTSNNKNEMPIIYNTNSNNTKKKEISKDQIKKEKIAELKFVLFNLPGQSTTLFTKKTNQNNIYYTEFLDRFIYFLYKEKEFDLSYKIILLGFGNGGHIALTYTSLYEKYWNILDTVILFNSYCRNGPILNQVMLEILKTVTREKNPKTVEAFIKQNIRNPKEFNMREKGNIFSGLGDEIFETQNSIKKQYLNNYKKESRSVYKLSNRNKNYYDNLNKEEKEDNNEYDNIENNMTLDGYKMITKGYFYNIPINLKDISTKILCVHSNVDAFINIHNISPIFDNNIPSYRVTPLKDFFLSFNNKRKSLLKNIKKISSFMGYDLTNFKKEADINRQLIIFDGSHDTTYLSNENNNIISTILISYFK